ncbi:hypothetical protein VB780_06230 [Leptolyngbya sp. CCNP1308]|uniref:hypothetical protein n=1 Tax=Leptolyngbya sp. CCNP1308 TaxID=3110255 RepID=UPI002B2046DD|nr:hypothetical protein [Leptolyngbya sp. CCNP1308]MEA5448160.1 hypothetical protein [Leptolyngbya sp. CCNP1308]
MASSSPLTGVILVDCAKANATEGLAIASERCGYGDDTAQFQAALRAACSEMNVTPRDLADLVDDELSPWKPEPGIEVAPDTLNEL